MTRNEKVQEFISNAFFLQLEQEQLERVYKDTKKQLHSRHSRDLEYLKDDLVKCLEETRIQKDCIELMLNAAAEEREIELLTYHYVNGLEWDRVAAKAHYDVRTVYRIHAKALSNIADYLGLEDD